MVMTYTHIGSRKANRFSFFIVGYATVFTLLALLGTLEATRFRTEQERIEAATAAKIASITHNQALYVMPQMEVMMNAGDGAHRLQLGINLQMDKKSLARFRDFQPKVSDRLVAFLGRQNMDDFDSRSGMAALRHDLLSEANAASGPVAISDVIFRKFVVR